MSHRSRYVDLGSVPAIQPIYLLHFGQKEALASGLALDVRVAHEPATVTNGIELIFVDNFGLDRILFTGRREIC